MNEQVTLDSINKKLDILISLLADKVVADIKVSDAIVKLDRLGLDRNIIAKILITTPSIVSVRLSQAKKKNKNKGD